MTNKVLTTAMVAITLSLISACGQKPEPAATAEGAATDYEAALDLIEKDALRGHVEWLADDERKGREAGTPEYDASAKYVSNFLLNLGVEPAGEGGWFQPVPLITYQIDTENNSVTVHRDGIDSELTYREHYAMGGDKVGRKARCEPRPCLSVLACMRRSSITQTMTTLTSTERSS